MNVLVGCEESQEVTAAFIAMGHNAMSCDLNYPGAKGLPHYQGDIIDILNDGWDIIIAFPPCTFLTVTGNRWFDVEKYGNKAIQRQRERDSAIEFFMLLANAKCPKIAIENPIGIMSTKWRKPDQIIQPYQFGDPFEKRTCLWLKGLPKLIPTKIVTPPDRVYFKSGKSMPIWYADLYWKMTREERARQRSKTFPGIAAAMAEQWTPKERTIE